MGLFRIFDEEITYFCRLMIVMNSRYNLILIEKMENISLQMQIEALETFIRFIGNFFLFYVLFQFFEWFYIIRTPILEKSNPCSTYPFKVLFLIGKLGLCHNVDYCFDICHCFCNILIDATTV